MAGPERNVMLLFCATWQMRVNANWPASRWYFVRNAIYKRNSYMVSLESLAEYSTVRTTIAHPGARKHAW